MWACSFIVDMLTTTYEPPAGIHAAMLVVLGAIFGAQAVRR